MESRRVGPGELGQRSPTFVGTRGSDEHPRPDDLRR